MRQTVKGEVFGNGVRRVEVVCGLEDEPRLTGVVPGYVLRFCPWVVSVSQTADVKGLVMRTVVEYPLFGVVDVRFEGGGVRRLFFVNRVYGTGIRDCVRLGVDAWRKHGGEGVLFLEAFLRRLPDGLVDGCEVLEGVRLGEAGWMLERCVAVGAVRSVSG